MGNGLLLTHLGDALPALGNLTHLSRSHALQVFTALADSLLHEVAVVGSTARHVLARVREGAYLVFSAQCPLDLC